jgi:hypothetical protein
MKEVKQRNREVEEAEDDVKQGTYRRSAWSSRRGAPLKGGGDAAVIVTGNTK